MRVSLRRLAAAVGASVDEDVPITGIAHDSRRVHSGELFVALPGTVKDGAEFVLRFPLRESPSAPLA